MNNVKEFGAVGDGIAKDTQAVQRAIDAGGTVFFPRGVYLCGTLYLRTGTTLELDNQAVIMGSPDQSDYNAKDFCPQNSFCVAEKAGGAHLIVALEVENVAIRGGRIDGNRASFFDSAKLSRAQFTGWRPSQMLFFCESKRIRIIDVELTNSPYWACFLHGCDEVQIRALRIYNQPHVWNGDGIDIDCCHNVTVSDCLIESSDDSLTIRAAGVQRLQHHDAVCKNIAISNCVLSSGQAAIRLGVGSGEIRNCVISNICIRKAGYGLCFLSTYLPKEFPCGAEGVGISNIQINNVTMENVSAAIDIYSNWINEPLQTSRKMIRNVAISNVKAVVKGNSNLCGNLDFNVQDIVLKDITLEITGGENIIPMPAEYFGSRAFRRPQAFFISNVKDVLFDHVRIGWKNESDLWTHTIWQENTRNITFRECQIDPPRAGQASNTDR
jgi:polygalacturonase